VNDATQEDRGMSGHPLADVLLALADVDARGHIADELRRKVMRGPAKVNPWSVCECKDGMWALYLYGYSEMPVAWGDDAEKIKEISNILNKSEALVTACKAMLTRHKQALEIRKGMVGFGGGKLAEEIALAEAALAAVEGTT